MSYIHINHIHINQWQYMWLGLILYCYVVLDVLYHVVSYKQAILLAASHY